MAAPPSHPLIPLPAVSSSDFPPSPQPGPPPRVIAGRQVLLEAEAFLETTVMGQTWDNFSVPGAEAQFYAHTQELSQNPQHLE